MIWVRDVDIVWTESNLISDFIKEKVGKMRVTNMKAFMLTLVLGFFKLNFIDCNSETLEQMLAKADSLSLHDLKDRAAHQEHSHSSHVPFQVGFRF